MPEYRQCPHGFHHPPHPHSCDGCWCEGERDRREYGWPHDTTPAAGQGMNQTTNHEIRR